MLRPVPRYCERAHWQQPVLRLRVQKQEQGQAREMLPLAPVLALLSQMVPTRFRLRPR